MTYAELDQAGRDWDTCSDDPPDDPPGYSDLYEDDDLFHVEHRTWEALCANSQP